MKIKYKVGKKEDIGDIPYGAVILNAKMVCQGNNNCLIYFPKKVKFVDDSGEVGYSRGCGCLSFAYDNGDYFTRSCDDYLNIDHFKKINKWLKKYEK